MSAEFDELIVQVKTNTDTEASAVIAINGIADKYDALVAAGPLDPVAVSALTAELRSTAGPLGAAIVARTPAEPGPQAAQRHK